MNILLLDTDVVSFLLKGDSRANQYASIIQGNRLALSLRVISPQDAWIAATAIRHNLP